MPRCIAFLRAVNVGGRFVRMEALRDAFTALGLAQVETFIASGNVIFTTRARDLTALERRIEAHLQTTFGFEIDTFIRTDVELAAILAHPAFDADATASARTHVVGFLRAAPDPGSQGHALFQNPVDRFHFRERELHWVSAQSQSESRFSNAAFERTLQTRATFRNLSSLRKLAAKLG